MNWCTSLKVGLPEKVYWFFFKYYIIDKLEIPDIVLYFVPANVSFNKFFWFISNFDKVQNHLDTLDLSTSQKRTFTIPRGNTCILVL